MCFLVVVVFGFLSSIGDLDLLPDHKGPRPTTSLRVRSRAKRMMKVSRIAFIIGGKELHGIFGDFGRIFGPLKFSGYF